MQTSSGEFQFIPGSHALPELLHYGTGKGHHGDYVEYDRILKTTLRICEERGLKTERFMAKKGDVLIWHADLMHGGAPIDDWRRTRKSLVAPFMPLGVMPTFFDFAGVNAFPYAGGGYCLDAHLRDTTREQERSEVPATPGGIIRPIDLWRSWVPVSARRRIPPSFATWVRAHIPNRK